MKVVTKSVGIIILAISSPIVIYGLEVGQTMEEYGFQRLQLGIGIGVVLGIILDIFRIKTMAFLRDKFKRSKKRK